jgi:hypothetical protein
MVVGDAPGFAKRRADLAHVEAAWVDTENVWPALSARVISHGVLVRIRSQGCLGKMRQRGAGAVDQLGSQVFVAQIRPACSPGPLGL